jgi:hypothetical protein
VNAVKVIIESPYAGKTPQDIARNVAYAKAAVLDCLKRGEAPYASHLFFTQEGLLDDKDKIQRKLGIESGLIWGEAADMTVVYTDRGFSAGMLEGITRASLAKRPIFFRTLPGWPS